MKIRKPKRAAIVRWILSLALCFGVYTETGPWTTLAVFLAMAGLEATGVLIDMRTRSTAEIIWKEIENATKQG